MQGFQEIGESDEVFQQAGISHGDALQKMRIMALLQLAARQRDLDFRTIQACSDPASSFLSLIAGLDSAAREAASARIISVIRRLTSLFL